MAAFNLREWAAHLVGLFLVVPPAAAAGGLRRPDSPDPRVEEQEDPHVEGEGADDANHHDHHHLHSQ